MYNENKTVCAKAKYLIKGTSEISERSSSIHLLQIYTVLRVSHQFLEK